MNFPELLTYIQLKDFNTLTKVLYTIEPNKFDKVKLKSTIKHLSINTEMEQVNIIYKITTDLESEKMTYKILNIDISFNSVYTAGGAMTHYITNATLGKLVDFIERQDETIN